MHVATSERDKNILRAFFNGIPCAAIARNEKMSSERVRKIRCAFLKRFFEWTDHYGVQHPYSYENYRDLWSMPSLGAKPILDVKALSISDLWSETTFWNTHIELYWDAVENPPTPTEYKVTDSVFHFPLSKRASGVIAKLRIATVKELIDFVSDKQRRSNIRNCGTAVINEFIKVLAPYGYCEIETPTLASLKDLAKEAHGALVNPNAVTTKTIIAKIEKALNM